MTPIRITTITSSHRDSGESGIMIVGPNFDGQFQDRAQAAAEAREALSRISSL